MTSAVRILCLYLTIFPVHTATGTNPFPKSCPQISAAETVFFQIHCHVPQMDSAYYQKLLKDKSLPLYNRATQQLTAPGSTFKPVTIAAGLQEGVIGADSSVFCDGVFDKVEPSLKCWKHSGHGTVANAPEALQFSCNDYMCEIAYPLQSVTGKKHFP